MDRQDSTPADSHTGAGDQNGWIGWIQIGGVIVLILIAALITLWLSSSSDDGPAAPPEQPPAPVRVVQPETGDHEIRVSVTGTVTVTAFVELAPQVGGRIVEVSDSARAGASFEADEVLFRIDPRDYEVAVSRARAALADARAALQNEQAQAAIARSEWESVYPDREITPLAARQPQLDAAQARLLAAQADLAQAELNLERTSFSLPFAGRITESRIEAGRLAGAGQALGLAYDAGTVEIVAPIAPVDLARLGGADGRSVQIAIEGFEDSLQGRIDRVGAQLNDRTRFIDLYIQTVASSAALQPGLFADLELIGPTLSDVMILPSAGLAGLETVRVIDNGVVRERSVTVLDRARGVVIVDSFDAADGVIISALPENAVGRDAQIVDDAR
jgi:RND family efflux transporter MFP subunit